MTSPQVIGHLKTVLRKGLEKYMQTEIQRTGKVHDSGLLGSQGWEGVNDRRCWINEQGRGWEMPFQPEERKESEEAKERLKCFWCFCTGRW